MPQVTGTYSTYDSVGQREDLEDEIYQIDREETPLVSMMSSTKVSATAHEWQTDTLATPSSNAHIEGDDYTYDAPSPTVRVKNYTQIFRKTLIVSETQEVIDKAGRDSEVAYQLGKLGVELRQDIELAFLSNNASVAGNDSTPRRLAGIPAWLTTNVERNSGSDGGYNSGTGLVAASTNGTLRGFTKALFDTVIQQTWESGGRPKFAMVSPYNKRVFSTFMSDTNVAQFRYAAKGTSNTIIASADVYVSDFGELTIYPNHIMGAGGGGASVARYVHVIDPSKVSRGVLRPIKTDTPARTGDAQKKVLITEICLVMKNEAAHGQVADVYGLTAST